MGDQKAEKIVSNELQESLYKKAMAKLELDPLIVQHQYRADNALQAASLFEEAEDYLDAPQKAAECKALAERVKEEEKQYIYETSSRMLAEDPQEHYRKLEKNFHRLDGYRDAKQKEQECIAIGRKVQRKRRAGTLSALFILLALAGMICWVIGSGALDYLKGRAYRLVGMYDYAMDSFEKLGDKFGAGKLLFACELDAIRSGGAGQTVRFGDYKWKILENSGQDQTALLIATDIDEAHDFREVQYNDVSEPVSWETSSLRKWLNTEVLEEHFREEERIRLISMERPGSVNEVYQTADTQTVDDMISVLSAEETEKYSDIVATMGNDCWIRTPGNAPDTAQYITAAHTVRPYGLPVTEWLCVRPVIKMSYADEQ